MRETPNYLDPLLNFMGMQLNKETLTTAGESLFPSVLKSNRDRWRSDPNMGTVAAAKEVQSKLIRLVRGLVRPHSYFGAIHQTLTLSDLITELHETEVSYRYYLSQDPNEQGKEIKIGRHSVKIIRAPATKTIREHLYAILLESLESGDIQKIRKCKYKKCSKYFYANRKDKIFCDQKCQWGHNNDRPEHRKRIKAERAKKRNRKAKKVDKIITAKRLRDEVQEEIVSGKRKPIR